MSEPTTTGTTIPMDAKSSAWYAGVATAAKTMDTLAESGEQTTGVGAFAYFWYAVGLAAGQHDTVVDTDTANLFMLGAAVRQPDLGHADHPVGIEAKCGRCNETFNPLDENDIEHIERADGSRCGGSAELVGSWS